MDNPLPKLTYLQMASDQGYPSKLDVRRVANAQRAADYEVLQRDYVHRDAVREVVAAAEAVLGLSVIGTTSTEQAAVVQQRYEAALETLRAALAALRQAQGASKEKA